MINEKTIQRMANKASQSHCLYRVAAMAISKRGEVLGYTVNKQRFPRVSGRVYVEASLMSLMSRYGKRIKTIIICRINRTGKLVKIDACKTCQEKADELGIKIEGIRE